MRTLVIDIDSSVPVTDQIVVGLRRAIALCELQPGDELPPVRQLANDLGVNLNTVARAYRELRAAGLVSAVRGRGTRVTSATEATHRPGESRVPERVRERLTDAVIDAKLAGLTDVTTAKILRDVVRVVFKTSMS